MQKKIKVEELGLGMYFCGFDAAWLDHPFWKKKFLLRNRADLMAARASGITHCWIDTERGRDVAPEAPFEDESDDAVEAAAAAPAATPAPALDPELVHAQTLCENARKATEAMFNDARMGRMPNMERCVNVVEDIAKSVVQSPNALLSVVRLKLADEYTYVHSVAVCALMVALGRTLGMDDISCREAGLGGFLHDVGKAFIPIKILNKPGALNDEERAIVCRHPELGHQYLCQDPSVPDHVRDVCLHHHEKTAGDGYPDGQRGTAISVYARMAAICDVYDAITSDRPYKAGWNPADALSHMAASQGHFDRAMFLAFVKTLGIYPVGSIVKLKSGRSGFVVRQNSRDLTRPVIKVFSYGGDQQRSAPEMLDLSATPQPDEIVQRGGEEWAKVSRLDALQLLSTGKG